MILSHVLSDPDSKFFFTTDSIIPRNAATVDLERGPRGKGRLHMMPKIRNEF